MLEHQSKELPSPATSHADRCDVARRRRASARLLLAPCTCQRGPPRARSALLIGALAWSVCALPATASGAGQVGVYGGVGPAEPLYTYGLVGGWVGFGSATLRLELSGSYQDGLETRSELSEFLESESLIDADSAFADRTLWTGEGLLRVVPLQGKLGFLQTTLSTFALHFGFGGGVRGQLGPDGVNVSPTALASIAADLHLGSTLLLRLDTRGFAVVRRDRSIGLGAEFALGVGAQW